MSKRIEAREVGEMTDAVAGLHIAYVRTDAGSGPCRVSSIGLADIHVSSAAMGFSTLAHTYVPDDLCMFVFIDAAPSGSKFGGVALCAGQLHFYAPGTPFVGAQPAGLEATVLVAPVASMRQAAVRAEIDLPTSHSVEPMVPTPDVEYFTGVLRCATHAYSGDVDHVRRDELLEAASAALASQPLDIQRRRRLDSRAIVLDCISFVDATGSYQPSLRQLGRAALASESRVRQAFVEVLGAPPTQFFRYSLLGRLRSRLLDADARAASVTDVAASLGVTQLGRVAGRYRAVFDELPSQTLQR